MEPHGRQAPGGIATARRPHADPARPAPHSASPDRHSDPHPGDGRPADGHPAPGHPTTSRRIGGLDGIRAIAIVAVVVFHLDPTWLPGGFLGVDVFLVVSGFLITALLLRERAETGRIDLRAFWGRRARRLLPPLLLLVPAAVLLARLTESDLLVGIGRQVLGALTFTTNWVEIHAGSDYFGSTAPTLLANLWSLAVEEQFYLVWPLALLLLLRVAKPTSRALVVLAAAAVSATLMATTVDPDLPTRVYYGTDTHAAGLMLGAALALALFSPARGVLRTGTWERHRRTVGVVALATLAGLFVLADERSAWTFRGGILLASVATTALVLVVVERPGRLRSLLDVPLARWLGTRSYGIYLWHWPVVLVVGQDMRFAPGGGGYVLTRLWAVLVTLAAADLSYRFLETPVRRLGVGGAFAALTRRLRAGSPTRARVLWGAVAVVAVAVPVVLVTAPERTSTEVALTRQQQELTAQDAASTATDREPTTPKRTKASASATTKDTPKATSADDVDWSMPDGPEIDAFGDSMLVGASDAMEYWNLGIRIDAKSMRRWSEAPGLVAQRDGHLRRAVVLAFGTNFGTDAASIRRTLHEIGPDRMVVVVTVHGDYARADSDNRTLRDVVKGYDNVAVADWDSALKGTNGMLQSDDIHPSIEGAHLYARVVRDAFAALSEQHTGKKVDLPPMTPP